jgi:F0F1-type ATP synthase membrane subunit b/b'
MDRAFLQQIVLLLLAALVSGFGIPLVMKVVEDRKLIKQKQFEADLARQEKLIAAQSKLLDDLTQILWKWRYLAKSVVYYRSRNDKERYDDAKKQYEEIVWNLLNEFRTEISRSRRLVSEGAFQNLNCLYDYVVHDLDLKISDLMSEGNSHVQEDCRRMADRFSKEVSEKLDQALNDLASELRLKIRA